MLNCCITTKVCSTLKLIKYIYYNIRSCKVAIFFGTKVIFIFVVVNENEINIFVKYKAQVELLFRISFPNADVLADLSKKFGCTPEHALPLIQHAFELGIRIKGLSFHVGPQTKNVQKYADAVNKCHASKVQ
ncbi:MAG: hypothetical protein HWE10_11905 [Gammaproteobacteria bacterium]|nr:hypothetical protein [Gammaproteobacteria bacterium]